MLLRVVQTILNEGNVHLLLKYKQTPPTPTPVYLEPLCTVPSPPATDGGGEAR
jgi:hypothetical protein